MLSKYVKLEAHNDDDVVRILLRKAYETSANRPFAIFIYNMPDIKQLADRRVDSNQDILEVFHKYYVDKGTLVPCPDYHLENSSGVGLNVVPLELSSGSGNNEYNKYLMTLTLSNPIKSTNCLDQGEVSLYLFETEFENVLSILQHVHNVLKKTRTSHFVQKAVFFLLALGLWHCISNLFALIKKPFENNPSLAEQSVGFYISPFTFVFEVLANFKAFMSQQFR
ncbi:hypothetical protein GQX74_014416 [Glossina fuscipes]|nr:hypothetical protein GQX74_014416 [Glossina fuscipes]